jgi:hypothetical protein
MPGNRPYDSQLALRLTQHMMDTGSNVVSAPGYRPELVLTKNPEFPDEPGKISAAFTAIHGLAHFITPEGRAQLHEAHAYKLDRELEVTKAVGEKIAMPPKPQPGKIGWVGTHKRTTRTPYRSEDLVNLGFQLMDNKNLSGVVSPDAANFPEDAGLPDHQLIDLMQVSPDRLAEVNEERRRNGDAPLDFIVRDRPATRGEEHASDRLEELWLKRIEELGHADWLKQSYNRGLANGTHNLSPRERRYMRKLVKEIKHAEHKAHEAEEDFEKIMHGQDKRGNDQIKERSHHYLDKADRIRRRSARRAVVRQAVADNTKSGVKATGRGIARTAQFAGRMAKETGEEYVDVAKVTGRRVVRGTAATGRGLARGTTATGRGVATGTRFAGRMAKETGEEYVDVAKTTGRGVAKGARATGRGVARGARKTREVAGKPVQATKQKFSPEQRQLNARIMRQLRNERNARNAIEGRLKARGRSKELVTGRPLGMFDDDPDLEAAIRNINNAAHGPDTPVVLTPKQQRALEEDWTTETAEDATATTPEENEDWINGTDEGPNNPNA